MARKKKKVIHSDEYLRIEEKIAAMKARKVKKARREKLDRKVKKYELKLKALGE